jgi:hypothetical protein
VAAKRFLKFPTFWRRKKNKPMPPDTRRSASENCRNQDYCCQAAEVGQKHAQSRLAARLASSAAVIAPANALRRSARRGNISRTACSSKSPMTGAGNSNNASTSALLSVPSAHARTKRRDECGYRKTRFDRRHLRPARLAAIYQRAAIRCRRHCAHKFPAHQIRKPRPLE